MSNESTDNVSPEHGGAIDKPAVSGSYIFKYRSMGQCFRVEVKKPTMNEAIEFFGRYYRDVDEILWAGWIHS